MKVSRTCGRSLLHLIFSMARRSSCFDTALVLRGSNKYGCVAVMSTYAVNVMLNASIDVVYLFTRQMLLHRKYIIKVITGFQNEKHFMKMKLTISVSV